MKAVRWLENKFDIIGAWSIDVLRSYEGCIKGVMKDVLKEL